MTDIMFSMHFSLGIWASAESNLRPQYFQITEQATDIMKYHLLRPGGKLKNFQRKGKMRLSRLMWARFIGRVHEASHNLTPHFSASTGTVPHTQERAKKDECKWKPAKLFQTLNGRATAEFHDGPANGRHTSSCRTVEPQYPLHSGDSQEYPVHNLVQYAAYLDGILERQRVGQSQRPL